MNEAATGGKIVTFYSYKGGAGRSMALANVAWTLASQGQRVLLLDWDLEAPGLHRYFHPFLLDKDLTSSRGLIDLVWDFSTEALTPVAEHDRRKGWYEKYANIVRYAVAVRWRFKNERGRIDLVPAGKQGAAYGLRINSFNWQHFYDRLGGGVFIESVKEQMRARYDYILVDSRTGVSDASGICTVQLPDILVVFYTANSQSIEGASAVAASVHEQWTAQAAKKNGTGSLSSSPRRIFPVMARVELAEKDKLELARAFARSKFDRFIDHVSITPKAEYWPRVETLYVPWYAYEEVLAAFGDKPDDSTSLLASAERLTAYLTDGQISKLDPPEESERTRVKSQFARETAEATVGQLPYDAYISYSTRDQEWVHEELLPSLQRAGLNVFEYSQNVFPGDDWRESLDRGLRQSRHFVPVMTPNWRESEVAQNELTTVQKLHPQVKVVPVMLEQCSPPPSLHMIQYADFTNTARRNSAMALLLRSLGGRAPTAAESQQVEELPSISVSERPQAFVAQFYAPPERLVGRRDELELLTNWAADSDMTRVFCLVGLGGVGKTALAWEWFHVLAPRVMTPLAGRIWWSFYQRGASFEQFVKLALAYVRSSPVKEIERMRPSEREWELLVALDREPYLLALDGLERILHGYAASIDGAEKQVTGRQQQTVDPRAGELLRLLTQIRASRVLVTTRLCPADLLTPAGSPVLGSHIHNLTGLSDESAVELLRSLGVQGSRESLLSFSRKVEGHPLVLQLLAGLVARYRRAPGNLERWLQDNPRFDLTTLPLGRIKTDVLEFALRGLGDQSWSVLRAIAALGVATYDELAMALMGADRLLASEADLDHALTELEERGLVGWDRTLNRYHVHPVVRAATVDSSS